MATIRLIPSTVYNAAGTSYLTVADSDKMLTNTDSTTYGTVTNTYASTSSRYVYLRGFNFGSVPSNAQVNSFTIKLKASETGASTSTSYRPRICDNTTTLTGSSSTIGTTANVITFTSVTASWDTIKGYGADFGIRINARRANSNSQSVINVYGAEIEVDYSLPYTITSTLTGNGTINPSGATSMFGGETYTLTISPTNASDTVTAAKNGSPVTLTEHTGATIERYPATYSNGGSVNGTNYRNTIGHSVANPSSSTGSDYFSTSQGGSGSTWIEYGFDFSDIPEGATITSVSVQVRGHCEDTSQSREIATVQLYSGSITKGSSLDFTSNSNTTYTMTPGTWTRAELQNAKMRFTIGVYGGLIVGATWSVTYTASKYYTYSYTVDGDATIAVTISGSATPPTITVGTPSRIIISDESGYDQCVCTFTSDLALQVWEARATKAGVTPARGVGLLVESGTTLAAGATGTIYVENEELTNGDGEYTITVYGQSTQGVWSE